MSCMVVRWGLALLLVAYVIGALFFTVRDSPLALIPYAHPFAISACSDEVGCEEAAMGFGQPAVALELAGLIMFLVGVTRTSDVLQPGGLTARF